MQLFPASKFSPLRRSKGTWPKAGLSNLHVNPAPLGRRPADLFGDPSLFWEKINPFLMPSLDWIQVAVSSYCNAACVYCPRTVYQRHWHNEHLSLETFRYLLPAFSKTRLIFLQGWGEPFLNPELFAMIHLGKSAGCQVGTTTNGVLLDEEALNRLVDLEVDILAFSLAGVDERNDLRRQGTRIEAVLTAIRNLDEIKKKTGKTKPETHIAYMLLRTGLADLAKLPSVLQGLGVSQVVISTLDFVPSGELVSEALMVSTDRERFDLESRLQEVAASGKDHGLNIHYHLNSTSRRGRVCTENVQRAIVVSATGEVSPCVFSNLPVKGVTFVANGKERPYQRLTFGSVRDHSLASIWGQVPYLSFRNSFYNGELASSCQTCPKL